MTKHGSVQGAAGALLAGCFGLMPIFVVSCVMLGLPYALEAVTFITPPYLQNMSPTGMVVMCETAEDAPLRVEHGPAETYGTTVETVRDSSGSGTWFHRARLTGLTPESRYHYRVADATGAPVSGDLTFHTAATGAVDFAFGVWGDSRGPTTGHGPPTRWSPRSA